MAKSYRLFEISFGKEMVKHIKSEGLTCIPKLISSTFTESGGY